MAQEESQKGGIRVACGHRVDNVWDYTPIEFEEYVVDRGDFEDGGGMATVYMAVCKDCLPKYIKECKAKITHQSDVGSNV